MEIIEIEIIVVDKGSLTLLPYDELGFFAAVLSTSDAHLLAITTDETDDVVFFEIAFYLGDADGQDADDLAGVEDVRGALVEVNFSFGKALTVGNPFFDT